MNRYFHLLLSLLMAAPLPTSAQNAMERFPKGDAGALFTESLKKEQMSDLNKAFALLWLDRDLPEANRLLRAAYAALLKDAPAMTPEIADENGKWQMRTWVRLYYLFADNSAWHPGGMETEVQQQVETLLWNYACAKSTVARADLNYVWLIQGSENHDVMDLVNAFLATQALAAHVDYQDRKLPDGESLAAHTENWTRYYTRYCEQRVKYGLLVEVASPIYGKYLIPELINILDFANDATLRAKMTTMLDILWADWALDQLDGVHGGGKTRCYQGKYSRRADTDSYAMMGQLLLRQGDWATSGQAHPIHGFNYILATSHYALPRIVGELALAREARGDYATISRRPGRMTAPDTLPPLGGHHCWYVMDAHDSRLVRYSWVTPDYIMGSFFVDPTMGESTSVEVGNKTKAENEYAAISGQNRWQGIIFNSALNARVFPQCVGHAKKPGAELTVTEIQHVAVQHENVLIVQANRATHTNKAMRVFFSGGMKERLQEHEGCFFLQEGNAYLAVKALSREDGKRACETSWIDDFFMRTTDLYAPVIFVTGRITDYPALEDFIAYVDGHLLQMKEGVLTYQFKDLRKKPTRITFYANEQRLPEVNGLPIDLAPKRVYDSPYMRSDIGSGKVEIQFQGESLLLDVNAP